MEDKESLKNFLELYKYVDSDPDILINKAQELDVDLNSTGFKSDISKRMAIDFFKLKDEEVETADFVFWISYFVEKMIEDWIMNTKGCSVYTDEFIDIVISKETFGGKIFILEKLFSKKNEHKKLIKLIRTIQEMRNNVAHGKFQDIKYGGYNIADVRGRIKIIGELKNHLLNTNK